MKSSRFYSFLTAQFLGAANDNAFKMLIILSVLGSITDETAQVRYSSIATAIFPAAFLLFSPIAGYWCDRTPKHRAVFLAKAPEILAMLLGTLTLWLGAIPYLFGVFFLMASQSAFFGPAKYGILPEVMKPEELSLANGLLQMTTNLAILLGNVGGVALYSFFKTELHLAGWVLVGVAILGTAAASYVPIAPEGNPHAKKAWNVFSSFMEDLRRVGRLEYGKLLLFTMLACAYFNCLGATFLTIIPIYGKNVLNLGEEQAGLLLILLSVGIALGSILAGKLSRGRIEKGLVAVGAAGLIIFASALSILGDLGERPFEPKIGIPLNAILSLLAIGVSAGFFVVPLQALMQFLAPKGEKGRTIAFSNVLSFLGILLAAVIPWFLNSVLGFGMKEIILFTGLLTLLATGFFFSRLPDFLVRTRLYLRLFFEKITVDGEEHLPGSGAAVLLTDAPLTKKAFEILTFASPRPLRVVQSNSELESALRAGNLVLDPRADNSMTSLQELAAFSPPLMRVKVESSGRDHCVVIRRYAS